MSWTPKKARIMETYPLKEQVLYLQSLPECSEQQEEASSPLLSHHPPSLSSSSAQLPRHCCAPHSTSSASAFHGSASKKQGFIDQEAKFKLWPSQNAQAAKARERFQL